MKARLGKVGDVYEVDTGSGLAYIHFTHNGGRMGEVVRVLPGLFSTRPDISELARKPEMYFVHFTLEHSLKEKLVKFVSNEPIPESAKSFPIMRKQGGVDRSGKTLNWFIGDGSKFSTLEEMRQALNVRELTKEQESLSIQQLWPYPALVKRLIEHWTPARDEEIRLAAVQRANAAKGNESGNTQSGIIEHYLYFGTKRNAELAADRLRSWGLLAVVRMGADGEKWLVLGRTNASTMPDIGNARREFEELASDLGGEYDGWGLPLNANNWGKPGGNLGTDGTFPVV